MGPEEPEGIEKREGTNPLVIGGVLLAVVAAVVFFFLRRGEVGPAPPSTLASETAPEEAAPDTPPAEPLPMLDQSDTLVRTLVAEVSQHPQLAAWLIPEDLVRRFVAAVDNVAHGDSPLSHVRFLEPEGSFTTAPAGDVLVIDSVQYARFDLLTSVFSALDTAGTVALYRRLSPLLEEAYRELGYPDGTFEDCLKEAVDALAAVPSPSGDVEVEGGVRSFSYADPELEALTQAQKHLLRMGPINIGRIQHKLHVLSGAAGLDALP